MPKIAYIEKSFRDEALDIINKADAIATLYQAQGFDLTLRQMYYQFVSRNWITNNEKSYKRLGNIISDARLAGYLDWDHIVDRTRNLRDQAHWNDPAHIIRAVSQQYREEKWAEQNMYVEVWIEKDALVGVLESVCPANDVPYFSCRGYTSQSEVWGAAQRLGEKIEKGKQVVVIHLGDHDPSGIDMSRDIEDRLRMFIAQDVRGASWYDGDNDDDRRYAYADATEEDLQIDRIALNWDQVQQYNPPPNPAKITDSRAVDYIRRFGANSWELDALDPTTLAALIQDAIDSYKDETVWQESVQRENRGKTLLTAASNRWAEVVEFLDVADEPIALEELDDEDEDE